MKLSRNTKKARVFMERFDSSEFCGLEDCCTICSVAKIRAFRRCKDKCAAMGGWRFRIISFNTKALSCAWLYNDKETGEIMLNVETSRNTYTFEY